MKKTAKNFIEFLKERRISTVAGAWVYYFLTALLPIVFLMITAFGVFGVDLTERLVLFLPSEFCTVGEAIVGTASKSSGGITVFFVSVVFFSGSALLNQMLKDGEFMYERKKVYKYGFLRRVFSLFALGVLFVVFLGYAFLSAFQNLILSGFNANNTRLAIILIIASVIVIGFFIIMLLNKFICPVKRKLFSFVSGSFVSLFIIVLGTIAFMLWLRILKPYNAFYGSLAGVIAFLLWAYILMYGLALGVSVNVKAYYLNLKKTAKTLSVIN